MMGEYLLYASGKLFGGVYNDRFLVKDTEASRAALSASERPYDGASEMMLVDGRGQGVRRRARHVNAARAARAKAAPLGLLGPLGHRLHGSSSRPESGGLTDLRLSPLRSFASLSGC
jgi:hypothetical protein